MKSWQINKLNLNALLSNELKKDNNNNFQYIKNCLIAPLQSTKISSLASAANFVSKGMQLPGAGETKKYKGYFASSSANGSFLNYNKIITYNFNSNLYSANSQVASNLIHSRKKLNPNHSSSQGSEARAATQAASIYIKDTYNLLFF